MLIPYYGFILSCYLLSFVNGHGRLMSPISKSEFCSNPANPAKTVFCVDLNWQYCGFVTRADQVTVTKRYFTY